MSVLAGASVVALAECALLLWTYRKRGIRLCAREAAVLMVVRELQAEHEGAGGATISQIVQNLTAQGWSASENDVRRILKGLTRKKNGYGVECEVVRAVNGEQEERWGTTF